MKKVLLIGGSNNGLRIETDLPYVKIMKLFFTGTTHDDHDTYVKPQYDEYYVERLKLGDQYMDFGILMGKSVYWAISRLVEEYR